MPNALYLYNSRDLAAIDFFQKLKRALADVKWQLFADFNEGLEGIAGNSFDRLATLVRETDAIIYAIGPLGTGRVQGNYEAGQVLQAQQQKPELKIVPALVQSATVDLIPQSLQHLTAQMDNSLRGGANVLAAVFKAVTGKELPESPIEEQELLLTKEKDLQEIVDLLTSRAQRQGLTLFVGPYASADVHGTFGPGDLGSALLKRTINPVFEIGSGDLLAHPWVASTASRLAQLGYIEVWDVLRGILNEKANNPLPLDARIAALARAWEKLGAAPTKGRTLWRGLLLVTTEHGMRIENALWMQHLKFARVRCSVNGVVIYERPEPEAGELHFKEVAKLNCQNLTKGTEAVSSRLDLEEQILVLKLMDCVTAFDPPPLATLQQLRVVRDRAHLPDPLPQHLQRAPFVMLGGGLLNPIVSQAFAHYFLPNFEQTEMSGMGEGGDEVPRLIAFHSWPGEVDQIRRFEQHVDATRPLWPRDVFKLQRVDWSLPELVSRLAYQLVHPTGAGAGS